MKCFNFSLLDLGCSQRASGTESQCHSPHPFLPKQVTPRTAACSDALLGSQPRARELPRFCSRRPQFCSDCGWQFSQTLLVCFSLM